MKRQVHVEDLINQQQLSWFHAIVILVSFLVMVLDGYDVAIMGFVAPQLRVDWMLSADALGAVLSAALIGQAVGALAGGPLADRFGRRPIVLASVACLGVWTIATAACSSVTSMAAYRLFTGFGMGAAIPVTSALISELMPRRSRSLMITLALCGFTAGGACGGFLAAWLIPEFGWRSVVLIGGVAPVVLFFLLVATLPESPKYLMTRVGGEQAILKTMRRISPGFNFENSVFVSVAPQTVEVAPISELLTRRLRFGTCMLWCAYFCTLFLIYLLNGWLPTLIKEDGGYDIAHSAVATTMFHIGGPIGALIVGWAMDRWNKQYVLASVFLIAAVCLGITGQVTGNYVLLCASILIIGSCLGAVASA